MTTRFGGFLSFDTKPGFDPGMTNFAGAIEAGPNQYCIKRVDAHLTLVWSGPADALQTAAGGRCSLASFGFSGQHGTGSFITWKPGSRTLTLSRDFPGQIPLYYSQTETGLLFATCIAPLLTVLNDPALNTARMLDFLVDTSEIYELQDTVYQGIQRALPGQTIEYRDGRRTPDNEQQSLPTPQGRSNPSQIGEQLTKACAPPSIKGQRIGVLVSGGIDSSAVLAVLAARHSNLVAISAVSDAQADTESAYIQALQKHYPKVEFLCITPEETAQRSKSVEQLVQSIHDPFDISFLPMIDALHATAARAGTHYAFNGIDGDLAFGFVDQAGIGELARGGQFRAACRTAQYRKNLTGESVPLSLLRAWLPVWQKYRRPSNDQATLQLIQKRLDKGVLNRDSLRAHSIAERILGSQAPPGSSSHHRNHWQSITHPNLSVALERYWRSADRNGIHSYSPFAQRQLLEYCACLPQSAKIGALGAKQILREFCQTRLPVDIVLRKRHGAEHLNGQYAKAFAIAHQAELTGAIEEQRDGLEYLFQRDYLERLLTGDDSSQTRMAELFTVGALAIWINQQSGSLD